MQDNARNVRVLREGKGGVAGANVSSPFPLPVSGVEAVWNHNLRWCGIRIHRSFGQAAVTRRGRYPFTGPDGRGHCREESYQPGACSLRTASGPGC